MDGKTVLLMLIGGGVAAYLAYSLAKGGSTGAPASTAGEGGEQALPPAVVDYGYDPGYQNPGGGLTGFGLGALGDSTLCRVAPSLCSWYNPAFVPRPVPGQLLW